MRKVFAIAGVALRNAVRSRMVLSLLVFLALVIVGLPATVKGDGTIGGQVQILIGYSLGLAMLILSATTLWSGCAAVSTEIEGKQIHLLVTKPVHRAQIWLGKWLGLLLLNALLLAVSGAAVYGMLILRTSSKGWTPEDKQHLAEEILVARRLVQPTVENFEAEARTRVQEMVDAGRVQAGAEATRKLQELSHTFLIQRNSVPRGIRNGWELDLPQAPPPDHPVFLEYKLAQSGSAERDMRGLWIIGTPDEPGQIQLPVQHAPAGRHTLTIPRDQLPAGDTLLIEFANLSQQDVTLFFEPQGGIQLMYHQGAFVPNLIRSLLLLYAQLALLSAIGLTAGTLFSMPVAAFTSLFLILLQLMSGFVGEMAATPEGAAAAATGGVLKTIYETASQWIYQGVALLLKPLQGLNPLDPLATGILVPWEVVASSLLVKVLLYSGLVGLLGILIFNRREVGIPRA